jgi:hypothetical protein
MQRSGIRGHHRHRRLAAQQAPDKTRMCKRWNVALRRSPNVIEESGYECWHLGVEIAGTVNNPDIGELGPRQEP